MRTHLKPLAVCLAAVLGWAGTASGGIPAAHVYHNHMPNFWPFYGVDPLSTYNATAVGSPVRYMYDGQVINMKLSPPAGYSYYLPASAGGTIMPHDDLVTYYTPDAKTGAYQSWPMTVANTLQSWSSAKGQIHVTMSGAVVNNVNSLENLQNVSGYTNPSWGTSWTSTYNGLSTTNGYKTLDLIHFTGHHSMGPLVGPDYFLKDLIYQNATLAQSYFLGSSFKSSNGFFPTELGFSERLIPTLSKLGVKWSVIGNNHFSRTLKDYPYDTYYPTGDTLISPPNRADLRNTSSVGSWLGIGMAHEQQNIVNKFPFSNTPHIVRYVDPATGVASTLNGIPVDQNGSWAEGWDGSTTVDELTPYTSLEPRQFFVVAHDGDNSGGRAGSLDTWQAGYYATCAGNGYCLGIDEYLKANPIPTTDVQHVQDGSWVDTRDSSSDPQWHHWKLPYGIWAGQFATFNTVNGMNLAPKKNLAGTAEGFTVSYEYGFHYLERNFALLQAALNYAKTAEQIWLDAHPSYWSPSTTLDNQITYPGNQLNPWMISYPVKGNAAADYAGGANPAELAWYFLLPAMDSGFGYYDENKDDHVKGTLAFNNSLTFSKPYVTTNIANDKTGPSMFWPQRWPYNPGSVNGDKSEGWTVHHFNNVFSVYTYAYDVSGIASTVLKIRPHTSKTIDNSDDTYKVYDPAAMVGKAGLSITPANVGAWVSYPMTKRDLTPSMNGVAWNKVNMDTMAVLPAQATGDLYYSYVSDYRDQLVDYYIESTDTKGNVTKSEIQQVYVGAGRYNLSGSKYVEDVNGTVEGTYPFLVIDTTAPTVPSGITASTKTDKTVALSWTASTDAVGVTGYQVYRDGVQVGTSTTNSYTDSGLTASTAYSYTVKAYDAANNVSAASSALSVTTLAPDTTAPTAPGQAVASSITASSVVLTWTAATDNYGVASYDIYRGGVKVGSSTTTSYTDSTLSPSTTYSYTIKALDAAGNASVASTATSVTSSTGYVATVYYAPASTWTSAYIHYSVGGTWTTSPGVVMDAACTGWKMKVINLGSNTGLIVTFNNGSGTWDSNGGSNYTLSNGVSAVSGGVISTTNPCVDTVAPTVPGSVTSTVTSTSVTLGWAASTDSFGVTGYQILRNGTQIGTSTTTSYVDSTVVAGTTYSYTVKAYDAAGNVSAASTAVSATPPVPDTTAPTAPTALASGTVTTSSVPLSWTAATDTVGVTGYQIYRGTTLLGTSATTSYTDSTVAASTTYSYTVKAYDAAGNISAASTALSVTTPAVVSNSATVYYYRTDWSTVNVHYGISGTWTTSPGTAMTLACAGYYTKTIALGTATSFAATFNNGSGTWDNNSGNNYTLGTGISLVKGGVITTGTSPCVADTTAPTVPASLTSSSVTSTGLVLGWTASTDAVGVTGYKVFRNGTQVGTSTTNSYTDSGLTAATAYSYTVQAYDAAGNVSAASSALSVTTAAASTGVTITFKVTATTSVGENVYIAGDQTVLGNWSTTIDTARKCSPAAYPVWTCTITFPTAGTAIAYKYQKLGLTTTWESGSNRTYTIPSTATTKDDGSWK